MICVWQAAVLIVCIDLSQRKFLITCGLVPIKNIRSNEVTQTRLMYNDGEPLEQVALSFSFKTTWAKNPCIQMISGTKHGLK